MCRVRLHLDGYPPWLLTLSRQGICCLSSVQYLQSYDLHKWLSSSPSSKIEIGVSKGLSILDFLKGYKPLGYKNSGLQWMCIKLPSAKSRRVFELQIYLSTDKIILFKSWIANMAGFLLWLSILWWRSLKSLQRNGYYFIKVYDLFYNGGNSPESLQAYDPALGGYII